MTTRLGTFSLYTPELAEDHPFYEHPEVLFCRDESGRDWYDLLYGGPIGTGAWVIGVDENNQVLTAAIDPTMIFPAGYTVYALEGPPPASISGLLGQTFDPDTGTFTPPSN